MATTTNINGSSDRFYRYKMPVMVVSYKKHTTIDNISKISRSLNRPNFYLEKWFALELSTHCNLESDALVIKGKHNFDRLQKILTSFIKQFVLCSKCDNPETELTVKSKEKMVQSCVACGYSRTLQSCQNKLIKSLCKSYIRPNKKVVSSNSKDDVSEDDDDDWCCDTSKDAVKQRLLDFFQPVPKPAAAVTQPPVPDDDDDFVVFEIEQSSYSDPAPTRDVELDDFIDAI